MKNLGIALVILAVAIVIAYTLDYAEQRNRPRNMQECVRMMERAGMPITPGYCEFNGKKFIDNREG
jgi:hypothetical protein